MDERDASTTRVFIREQGGLSIEIANHKPTVHLESLVADYFDVLCKGTVVDGDKSANLTKEQLTWLRNNFDWVKAKMQ